MVISGLGVDPGQGITRIAACQDVSRDDVAVTMTAEGFLSALASEVPEAQPVLRGHLEDNDELLLQVLTADLRRYAIDIFTSGSPMFFVVCSTRLTVRSS